MSLALKIAFSKVKRMNDKKCTSCKHFNGYDGINELWIDCNKYGFFQGPKKHCKDFQAQETLASLHSKIRKQETTIKELNDECERHLSDKRKMQQEIVALNHQKTKQDKQIKQQNIRIYCQDQEIQSLLQKIRELKE